MLDQNTDRMWYVIGAVIVGAALIFLMNGTFPTLFANVGTTFEDKVSEVSDVVRSVDPKTETDAAFPVVKGDGKNLWHDTSDFGLGFDVTYGGGSRDYPFDGGRGHAIREYKDAFLGMAFPIDGRTNPEANVYINGGFEKAGDYYTVSFMADRHGYGDIEYEVYFGETYVGSFIAGTNTFKRVSITGKAPTDLANENYVKIRSTFDRAATENAFWLYQPKLERGTVATPY